MRNRIITIVFVLMVIIGISVLLYPVVSDYLNYLTRTRVMEAFIEELEQLDDTGYYELIQKAREYNRELMLNSRRFMPSEEELERYNEVINFTGRGVIGSLEIEAINVDLPIYLTTHDSVLQVGIGHLEGSSLPVGGDGTHSVLTGHRGLQSALLLTDADKLLVGDTFIVRTLREALHYRIERIVIVEPNDFSHLDIYPYRDLVTLLTCTPFGINSHRMLLTGYRIFPEEGEVFLDYRVSPGARRLSNVVGYVFAAIPVLLVFFVFTLIKKLIMKSRD